MLPEFGNNGFAMQSARAAIAAGLTHIEKQVDALERAVIEQPDYAFDLAKTIVESACKTILSERSISFGDKDALPTLYTRVTQNLPIMPVAASNEAEVRQSLSRTLNGLHTALQGVCELRNDCGFASHGSDGPRPVMESAQALLAAQAADTIIGFLFRAHRQERQIVRGAQTRYDENEPFNAYVDDANDTVRIFALSYRPSEVLFTMDMGAYRELLAEFGLDDSENQETDELANQ